MRSVRSVDSSEIKVQTEEVGGRYTVKSVKEWEEKEKVTQRASNYLKVGRLTTVALRKERKITATPPPLP